MFCRQCRSKVEQRECAFVKHFFVTGHKNCLLIDRLKQIAEQKYVVDLGYARCGIIPFQTKDNHSAFLVLLWTEDDSIDLAVVIHRCGEKEYFVNTIDRRMALEILDFHC